MLLHNLRDTPAVLELKRKECALATMLPVFVKYPAADPQPFPVVLTLSGVMESMLGSLAKD